MCEYDRNYPIIDIKITRKDREKPWVNNDSYLDEKSCILNLKQTQQPSKTINDLEIMLAEKLLSLKNVFFLTCSMKL